MFTHPANNKFLLYALFANALFSGLSGLILTFGHQEVAAFIGFEPNTYLLIIGIGLLLFSADLFYLITRPSIAKTRVFLVIGADLIWVSLSILLLAFYPDLFNQNGHWLIGTIAVIVLGFAELQAIGLWKIRQSIAC